MTPQLPITDPALLDRLTMDSDAFDRYLKGLLETVKPREFEPSVLQRALAYPGRRPTGSFLLSGGRAESLASLPAEQRRELCDRFITSGEREPLLAIGANGAPAALTQKFSSLAAAEDREVLVLTGHLHDFDVCAAAVPPLAGPIPATLFPSRGTAVRASLLWLTAAQFTQLAWSELTYLLGDLRTRFSADEVDLELEAVKVFVSRFGCLRIDGHPVALAAVPAVSRTQKAFTQEAVLDRVAESILGPGHDAEALLREAFENPIAVIEKAEKEIRGQAVPFESELWTRLP
jgi:hypothetical protein